MIIREILKDPIAEVARFDFFNDYKDTRSWLLNNGSQDVIALLDAAHAVWLRKHHEAFQANIKDEPQGQFTNLKTNTENKLSGDGSHLILKGGIWASCGCKLTDEDGVNGMGFDTITLGDDSDFEGVHRCAYYGSACRKCRDDMQARNMLATREEADAWIRDGILPERMRGKPSA